MENDEKADLIDTRSVNSTDVSKRRMASKALLWNRLLALVSYSFYVSIVLAAVIILAQAQRGALEVSISIYPHCQISTNPRHFFGVAYLTHDVPDSRSRHIVNSARPTTATNNRSFWP